VVVVENELVGYGLRNRENNNNNVLLIIFTLQRQNHSSLPKPSRVESSRVECFCFASFNSFLHFHFLYSLFLLFFYASSILKILNFLINICENKYK
jgi:hypothetical protein